MCSWKQKKGGALLRTPKSYSIEPYNKSLRNARKPPQIKRYCTYRTSACLTCACTSTEYEEKENGEVYWNVTTYYSSTRAKNAVRLLEDSLFILERALSAALPANNSCPSSRLSSPIPELIARAPKMLHPS